MGWKKEKLWSKSECGKIRVWKEIEGETFNTSSLNFNLGIKEKGLTMIFEILILNGSVRIFRNALKGFNKWKL
jgi:hypothetical protein